MSDMQHESMQANVERGMEAPIRLYGDPDEGSLDQFIRELEIRSIHPVLLFGTAFSGKTTMLMSLLFYANNNPNSKIDIQYDKPDYLDKNPVWTQRINEGREYYEIGVADFGDEKLSGSTQKPFAFFIPVRITVKGETFRFAFLEGNGDWYERKQKIDHDSSLFDDFKPEINHILKKFKNAISVIFVAPATANSIEGLNKSDEGLANCITRYRDRNNGAQDSLLLLISKWDSLCDPGSPDSGFFNSTADGVLKRIEGRRYLWNRFSAIQLRDRTTTKSLMPYSAGWIENGGTFKDYDRRFQPVFDKFNRTLWNWIYGNATSARAEHGSGKRAILYSDVDNKSSIVSRTYLRIASTILWIRPD